MTVVDPTGTPVPVFNRSGLTIVPVTPTGTTEGGAASVPYVSGHMVVISPVISSNHCIKLSASHEIGDMVEVVNTAAGNDSLEVFFPDGEPSLPAGDSQVLSKGRALAFRKISASAWMQLASNP